MPTQQKTCGREGKETGSTSRDRKREALKLFFVEQKRGPGKGTGDHCGSVAIQRSDEQKVMRLVRRKNTPARF